MAEKGKIAMELLPAIVWIFSIIIGVLIGNARGRILSGLVWSVLFGPLGVIIVLCLENLKKKKAEKEHDQLVVKQMQVQQAQLDAQIQTLQQLKQPSTPTDSLSKTYRIARNGDEIGEMSISKVKLLLKSGHLTTKDYFFDPQINDWLQLEFMEELQA